MRQFLVPFRYTKFRRVWAGQTVNLMGDAVFAVAVALYLLPRPDAAQMIGLVLGMDALGGIVSLLVGGALADRHRRTRVVIAADLVRSGGLGGVILLGPTAPAWTLAAAAAVIGVGSGLYRPAYAALLPSLVPADCLPKANALRAVSNRGAAILGASAGGAMVTVTSPRATLWLDLASFLVSVVTLTGITDERPERGGARASLFSDTRAGISYVLRRPWMSAVMIQGTVQIAFVAGPVTVALPLLIGGRQQGWYGVVVAAEALGALAGASTGAWIKPRRTGRTAMLAMLAQLPQTIALAQHAPVWTLVPLSALAGAGLSVFAVLWTTTLQTRVPHEQLGRVFSIDALASTGLSPVGLMLSGWGVSVVGVAGLGWVATVVLALSVITVLPVDGVLDFSGDPVAEAARRRIGPEVL